MIAQQLSGVGDKVSAIDAKLARFELRIAELERVNTRLEEAASKAVRALQEISDQWDAVYDAISGQTTSDRPS